MTTVLLLSSTLAFAPMLRTPLPMQPMMPRLAAAPSMISVVEPFKRTAKFLSGDGVSAETVPCGDDETDECYALCDKEGCTVVGEVRATLQPPTLFSQPLCNLLFAHVRFLFSLASILHTHRSASSAPSKSASTLRCGSPSRRATTSRTRSASTCCRCRGASRPSRSLSARPS